MTNCKNCGHAVSEKFCSQCGQAVSLARIDGHYISHEIQHLLHFEKGFFYTAKEMLLRPGQSIREYLNFSRSRLSKPIVFLFFASIIYALIEHYFQLEFSYINFSDAGSAGGADSNSKKSSVIAISNWVQAHYGYANIGVGLFTSLWLRLFFRKKGFNIFEITCAVFFALGVALLMVALIALVFNLAKFPVMYKVMGISFVCYITWAIGQFFDMNKGLGSQALSYGKSFSAFTFGMVSFSAILITSGFAYDALAR